LSNVDFRLITLGGVTEIGNRQSAMELDWHEGPGVGEDDLREMQGDQAQGDHPDRLREPEAQATAGLTRILREPLRAESRE
jgi:hypothetical protein